MNTYLDIDVNMDVVRSRKVEDPHTGPGDLVWFMVANFALT